MDPRPISALAPDRARLSVESGSVSFNDPSDEESSLGLDVRPSYVSEFPDYESELFEPSHSRESSGHRHHSRSHSHDRESRYRDNISRLQSRVYNMAQAVNEPRTRRGAFKKFLKSDAPLSLTVADDLIAVSAENNSLFQLPIGPATSHGLAPHMGEMPQQQHNLLTGAHSEMPSLRLSVGSTDNEKANIDIGMDTVIENERGWFFFGYPYFSNNSLLPWDPSRWSSDTGTPISGGPREIAVPDDTWVWIWHTWYTDMCGDVDDQGWRYAWRFGSSTWHGSHTWFRSFVRRRIWRRLRRKVVRPAQMPQAPQRASLDSQVSRVTFPNSLDISSGQVSLHSRRGSPAPIRPLPSICITEEVESETDLIPDLVSRMNDCRIDRERIQLFIAFVTQHAQNTQLINLLTQNCNKALQTLQFPESAQFLRQRLEPLATNNPSVANLRASLDA